MWSEENHASKFQPRRGNITTSQRGRDLVLKLMSICCLENNPKSQNILYIVIEDKENQQTFTFKTLKAENKCQFENEADLNNDWIIKLQADGWVDSWTDWYTLYWLTLSFFTITSYFLLSLLAKSLSDRYQTWLDCLFWKHGCGELKRVHLF